MIRLTTHLYVCRGAHFKVQEPSASGSRASACVFWARHRRRNASLLATVTDVRGLERALRRRVQGYVTSKTSPAGEGGGQDPCERQHDQKDFILSLLMHLPVDATTQGGLAMLRSLERALASFRAKGNAVFAGETHYCDAMVAVVEDRSDDRAFVVETGRATTEPTSAPTPRKSRGTCRTKSHDDPSPQIP